MHILFITPKTEMRELPIWNSVSFIDVT